MGNLDGIGGKFDVSDYAPVDGADTNGATDGVNGHADTAPEPLNVLIVGAGIGGLTAAIALRKQGHTVQLFEQSRFASETGAAVHLAPNANGILRKLGIYAETFGANPMARLTEYTSSGEKIKEMDLTEPNKMWQHPWLLAHRVHLHDHLKQTATSTTAEGTPAKLNLCSRVANVDVENATVTLENGETVQGDLIVGADGVHSITRQKVPGGDVKPHGSGKSAYRFLVPKKVALEDPKLQELLKNDGELILWYSSDRRVVVYPTANNTLFNFACIHPESESAAESGDDWNQQGHLPRMLEVYKSFPSACTTLLSKADPQSLKVWKLLDMAVIPNWVNERLALLGDAAHPFLPHQGQGAGIAMEDAASLSVVLPAGTKRGEIPERLKLYEKIRYERANKIQEYSRIAGRDLVAGEVGVNMQEYASYNFGHDEFDNSTQKFREYTWSNTPSMYWRMPLGFGPMPGPRQSHYGKIREATQSTFTTASIKFKTSRTMLQNLFPPGRTGYRFKSPGTVAYASISQTTLNKMEWLGGSGYSHLGLYIHGVEYVKSDGTTVSGTYMPILFESLTDPIVSGREELGMPKLYTAIDIYRRANGYHIKTSWQGANWGEFHLENLTLLDSSSGGSEGGNVSGENDDGILVHRYIPAVGRTMKGKADADYPVFVPFAEDFPTPKAQKVYKAGKTTFKMDGLDWDALPTLHHIVGRMAELPVYEVVGGKVVEGVGVPDVGAARRVE